MKNRIKITIVLAIIIAILLAVFIFRLFLLRQIDDVTPGRMCDGKLLDKSEVLMVIPLLDNQSIADNREWCEMILKLNKTLGMHGVYHTEDEFLYMRDEEYIRRGVEEFNKCFGFYPEIFEAPQLELSKENEKTLKEMGFRITKFPHHIVHKVYHCTDFEDKSWLVKLNVLNEII